MFLVKVLFEFSKAAKEAPKFGSFSEELSLADQQSMAVVIEKLKGLKDLQIEVAGHTDSSGAAASNKRLSEERAAAVRDYLQQRGVASQRLRSVGYGEEQPKVSNDTPAGRAQNRRVELIVEGV